jgi:hypothetical protein
VLLGCGRAVDSVPDPGCSTGRSADGTCRRSPGPQPHQPLRRNRAGRVRRPEPGARQRPSGRDVQAFIGAGWKHRKGGPRHGSAPRVRGASERAERDLRPPVRPGGARSDRDGDDQVRDPKWRAPRRSALAREGVPAELPHPAATAFPRAVACGTWSQPMLSAGGGVDEFFCGRQIRYPSCAVLLNLRSKTSQATSAPPASVRERGAWATHSVGHESSP